MKLFIWRGPGVLQIVGTGIAFALAENEAQARQEILKRQEIGTPDDVWFRFDEEHLLGDPEVYENPHGDYLWGSE